MQDKLRRVCGVVAAILLVLILAHVLLGAFSLIREVSRNFEFLIWLGVMLIAAHIGLSGATTAVKLTDAENPPSDRKKRHFVLKWASGAAVVVAATIHVAVQLAGYVLDSRVSLLMMVLVATVLAWHMWVGAKSIVKDLGLPKKIKPVVRLLTTLLAALAGILVLFVLMGFLERI